MSDSGFLTVGDWRLEYTRHGPGPDAAPTLVMLHEGLGCLGLWRDLPAELARRTGLGVLAYSRAGYGASDARPLPWPGDFMDDEAARILPEVLRAAGIRRAILLGHSDGATIALLYAAAPPAGEADLLGLVLMSPHVLTESVTLSSIRKVMEIYETGRLRERLARYHGDNVDIAFHGWSGAWTSGAFDSWSIEERLDIAFHGWSGAWTSGAFDSWSIEERLATIAAPSLVIQGLDDEYGTLDQVERLAAASGGPVERLLLENCAHSPHVDQREAALTAIAGFARKL